jgi:predicted HicB family RNase H-like nuclease
MATETLYLRVDPDLEKKLRDEAEHRQVSMTALCVEFLAAGIKRAKR